MNKRQFDITKTSDIKTLMMLTVVFYHSICLWSTEGWHGTAVIASPFLAYCAKWFNGYMVQTFTFVSAYIYSYLRNNGKYSDNKKYIKSRAERLLIPYCVFVCIWAIPFYIISDGGSFVGVIKHYFLGVQPDQLWFLLMLFLLSTLFCLIYRRIEHWNPIIVLIILCAIYPIGLLGQSKGLNYFQICASIRYLVYFYFGLVYEKKELKCVKRVPALAWFVIYTGISLLKFFVLSKTSSTLVYLFSVAITPIVSLSGIMMSISIISKFDFQALKPGAMRIYDILKKYSFTIYLLHMQIIVVMNGLLNGKCSVPIHVVCNFVISMSISLLISIAMSKIRLFRTMLSIR